MANKKQERNSANRQRDAQKRGRTEKKVKSERNAGKPIEHTRKAKDTWKK